MNDVIKINLREMKFTSALGFICVSLFFTISIVEGDITDNLIGHWKLNESDPNSLVVLNSAPVADPEHGERTQTMQLNRVSPTGTGYYFDGAGNNDFVSLGTSYVDKLRDVREMSFSGWIWMDFLRPLTNPDQPFHSRQTIIGANFRWYLTLEQEGLFRYIVFDQEEGEWQGINPLFEFEPRIPAKEFVHIGFTHGYDPEWDDMPMRLYINGELVDEFFAHPSIDNLKIDGDVLHLGRFEGFNVEHLARDFDGVMSDIGLWAGRELTHAEIAMIGGMGRAGVSLSAGEIDEVLALYTDQGGTVTTGDWEWSYTTSFGIPADGSALGLGKHYYGEDDHIYVILGGSEGNWTGVTAEGGEPFGIPIRILEEPEDVIVNAGETAMFEVEVASVGAVEYQWHFLPLGGSSVELVGETGLVLTRENVGIEDWGHYFCEISEVDGDFSVISRQASLTILGTSGLIGHWKLDETDPASLVVHNSGLIGGPGERTTTIEINQTAPVSRGYLFDGVANDDVVAIGTWPRQLLNTTNELTYSAWIKPTFLRDPNPSAAHTTRHNLISLGNPAQQASFFVSLQTSDPGEAQFFIWVPDGQATWFITEIPEPVKVGEFTHVAVTRAETGPDETTAYVYVNGVMVHAQGGLSAGNFQISDHPNYLGRQHGLPARDFDGIMSDVGLWSGQALSGAEIAIIGGLGRAGFSLSSRGEIDEVLALYTAQDGTVITRDWEWSYTTSFGIPADGSALGLGKHYYGEDDHIYVILGGSEGSWTGLKSEAREPGDGYDAWAAGFGLDPYGDGAFDSNPSGDGIENLLKYALGLNPHLSERGHMPWETIQQIDGENYLTLTFTRPGNLTDVIYHVEASGDLADWTSPAVQYGEPVENGDGTVTVTYRDSEPIGEADRRFLRLRVERGL